MNKYAQVPESVLDLHGMTTAEAKVALEKLLREKKYNHVRVITGKGTHSTNGVPVLREFTKQFLASKKVRFNQSKLTDGGEGSLEVFLN